VDRLHAVSRDKEGPLVIVFFDFETTGGSGPLIIGLCCFWAGGCCIVSTRRGKGGVKWRRQQQCNTTAY
jgi:hypothetical protein